MKSGVIFYGSKGYLVARLTDDRAEVYLGGSTKPEPALGKLDDVDRYSEDQLSHFHNFFDAIRSNQRDMLTAKIHETYASTAITLLANISYRLGREVRFDRAHSASPGTKRRTACSWAPIARHLRCRKRSNGRALMPTFYTSSFQGARYSRCRYGAASRLRRRFSPDRSSPASAGSVRKHWPAGRQWWIVHMSRCRCWGVCRVRTQSIKLAQCTGWPSTPRFTSMASARNLFRVSA